MLTGCLTGISVGRRIVTGDPPDDPVDPSAARPESSGETRFRIQRLIVVEDDVFIRLDIEGLLRGAGYDVVGSAESANEAVRLADQDRPDLMIMDIRLIGKRDGIEAAIEIWQRFGIRSVLVSGNLDAQNRQRAVAAEPWGFVEKPFSGDELVAAIQRKN